MNSTNHNFKSTAAARDVPRVLPAITPEAMRWALKELARRAGVSPDLFASWRIEFRRDCAQVWVNTERTKSIIIATQESRTASLPIDRLHTNRRIGLDSRENCAGEHILPVPIPYCVEQHSEVSPLFVKISESILRCDLDILATVLLTLGRAEEYGMADLDEHGRFPAQASIAWRDGFLDRPVIDEIGLIFAQAVKLLLPRWSPERREFAVKLSHDIDDLDLLFSGAPRHTAPNLRSAARTAWMALPSQIRGAIQQTSLLGDLKGTARWVGRIATGHQPNARDMIHKLFAFSRQSGLDSAFYWKASRLTPFDSGYNPCSKLARQLMREAEEMGFENGVHPGYYTFENPAELHEEVTRLESALGRRPIGGRQHYLRWSPRTWRDWEGEGLQYDSSLSYAEHFGFRAGTCIPYMPWFFEENREAALVELPLLVMDGTLTEYLGQNSASGMQGMVEPVIRRCRQVSGVFTFLCHNTTLSNQAFVEFYLAMMSKLEGAQPCNPEAVLEEIWDGCSWTCREGGS